MKEKILSEKCEKQLTDAQINFLSHEDLYINFISTHLRSWIYPGSRNAGSIWIIYAADRPGQFLCDTFLYKYLRVAIYGNIVVNWESCGDKTDV